MLKYFLLLSLGLFSLLADEGMWLFNAIPQQYLQTTYGITLDKGWLDRLQRACLRVSLGGSASFVSSQGLLLTNHHVGSKAIYHLSSESNNLMENGFLAHSLEEELPCPNLYVDKLISIQDVTDKVIEGLSDKLSSQEKEAVKKAAIATLIQEAKNTTYLQPQVVSLYQGARYHLYLYKRYSDIRLVMAPEKSIAFFGGNEDNFEFPRYDLDICFFRVYDDGKPLSTPDYLPWSPQGPQENIPLFVAGHPGKTDRMLTAAHLRFFKEVDLPLAYRLLEDRLRDCEAFSLQHPENQRIAAQDLFSIANTFKVIKALTRGLQEESLLQNKLQEELSFQESKARTRLEAALKEAKDYFREYLLLEKSSPTFSKLFTIAKHLVRLAEEGAKPETEKLPEYLESELATLRELIVSEEPIYKELEKVHLRGALRRLCQELPSYHPALKLLSETSVDAIFDTTTLFSKDKRAYLLDHPEAITSCQDSLIAFVKA
ncbi:MAG: S46 family peptidase, partial [Chlamydiae bacterium]|nr:S46 family peptidase [Chlamydiota bacterium]